MFPENALIVIQGDAAAGKTTLARWFGDQLEALYYEAEHGILTPERYAKMREATISPIIFVAETARAAIHKDIAPDMIITVERGTK